MNVAVEALLASRERQGLPRRCSDPTTMARIAAVLAGQTKTVSTHQLAETAQEDPNDVISIARAS